MTHDMQRLTPAGDLAPLFTLAEVKTHLRVHHLKEDELLSTYIAAAEDYLDGYDGTLGRALRPQRWRLTLDAIPASGVIRLPLAPFTALHAIAYDTESESAADLDLEDVKARRDHGFAALEPAPGKAWPSCTEIRIDYDVGPAPADEPRHWARIRAAGLLIIGDLYDNRSGQLEGKILNVNPTVERLLAPIRVRSWA